MSLLLNCRDGILKTVIDDLQQVDVDAKTRSQDLVKSSLQQYQSQLESLKSEVFKKIKDSEHDLQVAFQKSLETMTSDLEIKMTGALSGAAIEIDSKLDELRRDFHKQCDITAKNVCSQVDSNYKALKNEVQAMIAHQVSDNELCHSQTREYVDETCGALSKHIGKLNSESQLYKDTKFASVKSIIEGTQAKLEDVLLRSLGSIVKEMKQQQSETDNRFKQLHADIKLLNKNLESVSAERNDKCEEIDILQNEVFLSKPFLLTKKELVKYFLG